MPPKDEKVQLGFRRHGRWMRVAVFQDNGMSQAALLPTFDTDAEELVN